MLLRIPKSTKLEKQETDERWKRLERRLSLISIAMVQINPEMDTTDLLDEENTVIYQSLIGALQWNMSLGRPDIATTVMTLSRFRTAPRQRHLERLKHIHKYMMEKGRMAETCPTWTWTCPIQGNSTRATEIEHMNCMREIRENHERATKMREEDRPN